MIRTGIAVLVASLLSPQEPAPSHAGVVVRDVGVGFHASCELPNLPLRQGEPRRPPYVGRMDTWMPFQITLENNGAAVEGSLILRDPFTTGAPDVVFRKRVTLAARSRKHVRFPVLHRGGQGPRELLFEDDRGSRILLDGARTIAVSPPHTTGATSTLVMVATESRGNFSHFLGRSREGTFAQQRYVLPVVPAELPTVALEYHGITTLVLDDIPVDTLSADQQESIRQFVARGGTLVVSLFRHAERLSQTKLADLMPGTQDRILNVKDVGALRTGTGYACPLDPAVAMTTFKPGPGAAGWDDSARVLVHRRFERGLVVACGFPFSAAFLETWPGSSRFLELLTETSASDPICLPGGIQSSAIRTDIARALKESMVRSIPPFKTVLWLMVGYGAVIAILPYAIFRRLNRLEWSWVAVFIFAGGGAGVVYGVGQSYLRKDSAAYRVGVIDGGSEEGVHLRHNFWSLFTARGDRLDLSFEDSSAVPYVLGRELKLRGTTDNETLTVSYDELRIADLRTYSQDSTLFETTDRVGFSARLLPAAGEAPGASSVHLSTGGSFRLRRAWIVGAEDISKVPDFPGAETVIPVPNSTLTDVFKQLQAANDKLLEKVATILIQQAQARSKLTRRRVLLYLYDGAPSLKNQGIPERGLDFGFLDVEGGDPVPAQEHWQFRRLGSNEQDVSYESALYGPEGIVYSLVLKDLPAGCRVKDIAFGEQPFLAMEVYDHRARSWLKVRGTTPLDAAGVVHESPLGCAYALLRTKAGRTNRSPNDYPYYGGVPPQGNMNAVSRIERKSP